MTSDEYATWKNTFEADVHKKQMSNIMDHCGKYDEACNKACDMLISSKYMMTDDVRTMVVEHPLFNKMLSNTDPDKEEIERYALGQNIITDVNADGVISKKLESYKSDTSAEVRSSSRGKKTAVAEENVKITFANRPVSSGIRSKNLVLLLKIIRAVVLRLSPDSQQLQINELDRCW